MLTPEQLTALSAAEAAMTPPPWEGDGTKALGAYGIWTEYATHPGHDGEGYPSQICSMMPVETDRPQRDADAAGICALRNAARELIEAAKRWQRAATVLHQNDRLRSLLVKAKVAMEPFAKYANIVNTQYGAGDDVSCTNWEVGLPRLTLGDCRQVAAVLAEIRKEIGDAE